MVKRPFHRPSTVDQLDPKVREEITRLRIDDGFTLDQIIEHLKGMGAAVSRSALHRHLKPLQDRVGDQIKELRDAAASVGKQLTDADDVKVGALNRELAHSILMRIATARDKEGEMVQFDPMEAMLIAKGLDHLASAEKKDADRALKIRKETASETLKATDAHLRKAGQKGVSKEGQALILKDVLGIAPK